MKKLIVSTAAFAVVAFSAVAMAPTSALANSAFARQTGQACHACHFQSIPRLNTFGSKFRINAFRDTGTQGLVEDEGLSLPASFNAGLNMALGISNGSTDDNGVEVSGGGVFELAPAGGFTSNTGIAWPTEAELVVGGRYGDNFGGVTSISLIKTGLGHEVGLEHYKLAFVYDTEAGPVAIAGGSTTSRGATYLFNDPSNTISTNLAGWHHQSDALQTGGTATLLGAVEAGGGVTAGAATGLGIYTHLNGMGYLAVGGLIPAAVNTGVAVNFKISPYVRAAFTGSVAGFDLVAGGWYYANKLGDFNAALLGLNNVTSTQYGIDLQAQGVVNGISVGFYLPWQIKGESIAAATATSDEDWTGVYPMLTAAMGPFGGRIGYDYSENEGKGTLAGSAKIKYKTVVVGVWYDVAQNVVLDIEYDNRTIDNVARVSGDTTDQDTFTAVVEYVY